jgi:hypothetical protein
MNKKVTTILALSGVCSLQAIACSSSHAPGAEPLPPPGEAGYALPPVGDDSGDVFPDADEPAVASVRIADVSPDAPALDVCVALHGTGSFRGPLLAELAARLNRPAGAGDGGGDGGIGVSYAQVSAYVALAPGRYDVRLVAAGSTSCAAPGSASTESANEGADDVALEGGAAAADAWAGGGADASVGAGTDGGIDAGSAASLDGGMADSGADAGSAAPLVPIADFEGLPSLQAHSFSTLLLAGELSPVGNGAALTAAILTDDAELAGGAASLRAINAMPTEPVLDFGLGSGSAWVPMLTDVAFARASEMTAPGGGVVDENGYVPIPTFAGQAMSARQPSDDGGVEAGANDAGDSVDVAIANSVDVELGSIATLIAIGGASGDTAHPAALLVCIDNQPSGGLLADCSVAQ